MAETKAGAGTGAKSTAKPRTATKTKAATTAAKPKTNSRGRAKSVVPAASTSSTHGSAAIRSQVNATADTIRAEAQRKVTEIGDEVSRLYAQAGDRAREAANQGKHRAAGGLDSLAKIIEDSATEVDDRLGKQYGDYARSAAQTVASLAGTLDEKDLDELVTATRDFVRKSPAVAIGSAAVVGFMLARLLRSRN